MHLYGVYLFSASCFMYTVCVCVFVFIRRQRALQCTPQSNFSCSLWIACTTLLFMFTSHSKIVCDRSISPFFFICLHIPHAFRMFRMESVQNTICLFVWLFVHLWVADLWFNLIVDEVKMSEDESLQVPLRRCMCVCVCVFLCHCRCLSVCPIRTAPIKINSNGAYNKILPFNKWEKEWK